MVASTTMTTSLTGTTPPTVTSLSIFVGVHLGFLMKLIVEPPWRNPLGGFSRRKRDKRGFFDSRSHADESDNLVSNKSIVLSKGWRFSYNDRGFERERRVVGFSSNDGVGSSNWGGLLGLSKRGGLLGSSESGCVGVGGRSKHQCKFYIKDNIDFLKNDVNDH